MAPIKYPLSSPIKGINRAHGREQQPPETCWDALNVLPYDQFGRARVAQRNGVDLYAGTTNDFVQNLTVVNNILYPSQTISGAIPVASYPLTSPMVQGGTQNLFTTGNETYTDTYPFSVTTNYNSNPSTVVAEINALGPSPIGGCTLTVQNNGSGAMALFVTISSEDSTEIETYTVTTGGAGIAATFAGTLVVVTDIPTLTITATISVYAFTESFTVNGNGVVLPGPTSLAPWPTGAPAGSVTASSIGPATVTYTTNGTTVGSVYNTYMTAIAGGFFFSGTFEAPMQKSANQASAPLSAVVPVATAYVNGYIYAVDGTYISSLNVATNTVVPYSNPLAITLTSTGTAATATLVSGTLPALYASGTEVTIAGDTNTAYNGAYTIIVTSNTTFTYTLAASTGSSTGSPTVDLIIGTAPTGTCLACNWRGRLVLAGDKNNPQNFYMARTGNPYDWNYAATDPAAAVAGNLSTSGQIGEPITCLIPYTDDYMLVGCTNSLWMLEGDPADGGTIVRVSNQMGVVGPNAWCVDPQGLLYFVSSGGLFTVKPLWEFYQPPTLVSGQTYDQFFQAIDWSHSIVTMVSDFDRHYIYLFVTPSNQAQGSHLIYDLRNGGLWPTKYPQQYGPTAAVFSVNDAGPANRNIFFGGWDGNIRRIGPVAVTDEGNGITCYVVLGPIQPVPGQAAILNGTTVTLGEVPFPGTAPTFINNDTLSPPPNPPVVDFNTANVVLEGSLQIFLNGVRLNGTTNFAVMADFDYYYDQATNVVFTVPPPLGSTILAQYQTPTTPTPNTWNAIVNVASGYDAFAVTQGLVPNFGYNTFPGQNGASQAHGQANISCVLERRQTIFRQRLRGEWFSVTISNDMMDTFFSFESAVLEFVPAGRNRERR